MTEVSNIYKPYRNSLYICVYATSTNIIYIYISLYRVYQKNVTSVTPPQKEVISLYFVVV